MWNGCLAIRPVGRPVRWTNSRLAIRPNAVWPNSRYVLSDESFNHHHFGTAITYKLCNVHSAAIIFYESTEKLYIIMVCFCFCDVVMTYWLLEAYMLNTKAVLKIWMLRRLSVGSLI